MKKKLSSDFTPLYKSLWLVFAVGAVILAFVSDMPINGRFLFFMSWMIGTFIFWALFYDLRSVEVDANFLYAKNGRIAAAIPLSTVKSVQQEWLMLRYPVIVVKLKIPTRLGSEIKFIPYYAFTWFYRQHPLVNELKHLAKLPAG
jgi:hypothetical protein